MKICLVGTFPPSGRQLNEYSFHIARELSRNSEIELTILADELDACDFATDASGKPLSIAGQSELDGFNVVRCWKFGSLENPMRLLKTIRRIKPDVVWYNLVFSSFATPENPVAAFAGLSAPALTRAAGFYTHITLHHILEHVDFAAAGVKRERLFRIGTELATRALLKAHSVSVLLPGYHHTLVSKYSAQNVLLGTHGTFATTPTPPDFSKRGNPDKRLLAIGHWGTYKRLETLMEAFPWCSKKFPRHASSSPEPITTPARAIGNPFEKRSQSICPSSSAATLRKTTSPSSWHYLCACASLRLRHRFERPRTPGMRIRRSHRQRRSP